MYEEIDQPKNWESLADWQAPFSDPPEFDTSGEDMFDPQKEDYPDTEVTYCLFREEPGFDQMYEQSKDWLEMSGGMLERYKIYPVNFS